MGYGGPPPPQGAPGYPPGAYPSGAYPMAAPPPAPRRPLQIRKRLLLPTILLLLFGVLLLSSLGLGWFYESESQSGGPTTTGTLYFSSSCVTTSTGTQCSSVSSSSSSGVANIMGGAGALAGIGGALGLFAGVLALLGTLGKDLFRRQQHLSFPLGLLGAILGVVAPIVVALGLPSAFNAISSTSVCGTQGPQAGFLGSCTGTASGGVSVTLSWGPDVAWYLCFVAFLIGLLGAVRVRRAARQHSDEDLMASAFLPAPIYASPHLQPPASPYSGAVGYAPQPSAPQPTMAPAMGYAPMPPGAYAPAAPPPAYAVTPSSPSLGGGTRGVVCRNCGTVNPQGAYTCGRCEQRLF
jgi:hypothetical protein